MIRRRARRDPSLVPFPYSKPRKSYRRRQGVFSIFERLPRFLSPFLPTPSLQNIPQDRIPLPSGETRESRSLLPSYVPPLIKEIPHSFLPGSPLTHFYCRPHSANFAPICFRLCPLISEWLQPTLSQPTFQLRKQPLRPARDYILLPFSQAGKNNPEAHETAYGQIFPLRLEWEWECVELSWATNASACGRQISLTHVPLALSPHLPAPNCNPATNINPCLQRGCIGGSKSPDNFTVHRAQRQYCYWHPAIACVLLTMIYIHLIVRGEKDELKKAILCLRHSRNVYAFGEVS